jgi:hypothetical protein
MTTVKASLSASYNIKDWRRLQKLQELRRLEQASQVLDMAGALIEHDVDLKDSNPAQEISIMLHALDSPAMVAFRLSLIKEAPQDMREAMWSELFDDISADLLWKAKRIRELKELDVIKWKGSILDAAEHSGTCTCQYCKS